MFSFKLLKQNTVNTRPGIAVKNKKNMMIVLYMPYWAYRDTCCNDISDIESR